MEEGAEHVDELCSLEGGGLGEGAEDGDVFGTGRAAGSHADFPEDYQRAQGALCMVVGGRAAVLDEGEDLRVFAGGWDESLAEGFGFFEGQRFAADRRELFAEHLDEFFACPFLLWNIERTRFLEKRAQGLAEPHGWGVGIIDQGELLADFFALAQEVSLWGHHYGVSPEWH